MWGFIFPIFLFSAIVGLLATQYGSGEDEKEARVRDELAAYAAFVQTAESFFKTAAVPAGKTVYRWSDIRSAAAPSIVNLGVSPTWKVVRDATGSWAACTSLSEVALAKAGGLFPAPETGGTSTRIVSLDAGTTGVGAGDDATVLQAVNLCKGT